MNLIEQGQTARVIGAGLEMPRDSRGFYPERYADPWIVRRLRALSRHASLEWDRVRGRWTLYDLDPKYVQYPWLRGVPNWVRPFLYEHGTLLQEANALVCTWQWPDGSYRPLSMDLVRDFETAIWRLKHYEGLRRQAEDAGQAAADFDRELEERREALRQRETEKVWQRAREDMAERYWHIKANADKNIYDDPVKAPERKIISLPGGPL